MKLEHSSDMNGMWFEYYSDIDKYHFIQELEQSHIKSSSVTPTFAFCGSFI